MRKILLLTAIACAAFAQPAMASIGMVSTTAEPHSATIPSPSASMKLKSKFDTREKQSLEHVEAQVELSDSRRNFAGAFDTDIEAAAAAGWPCNQADVSNAVTIIAMREAAAAITAARSTPQAMAKDCECEDCKDGLCTEEQHSKTASGDCEECVDAARFA